jgi:hypothetical protein
MHYPRIAPRVRPSGALPWIMTARLARIPPENLTSTKRADDRGRRRAAVVEFKMLLFRNIKVQATSTSVGTGWLPSVLYQSHGRLSFSYVVSTPHDSNARSIDAALPTVLFLHCLGAAKSVFHSMHSVSVIAFYSTNRSATDQFTDPALRRFNLVALDLPSHGDTTGTLPDGYNEHVAADYVVGFMVRPPFLYCVHILMPTLS